MKMTDGEVMVYLRNHLLALKKIATERGVPISVTVYPEGTGWTKAGRYEVVSTKNNRCPSYSYEPSGKEFDISDWESDISPESIDFSGPPLTKHELLKRKAANYKEYEEDITNEFERTNG